MSRLASIVIVLAQSAVTFAAKAKEPEPQANPIVDYIQGICMPVGNAALALASDGVGLIVAAPNFAVDVFVYLTGLARQFPDMVSKVYNGDDATLDSMTSFCTYSARVIFTVYASLTALNLVIGLFVGVKNYFKDYMVIPTDIMGQKLPGPALTVRNMVQKEVLDRIRNFSVGAWIVPLEGQSGTPSLAGATPLLASAVSACMILACAPNIASIMKNGADKAAAESLAYTLGTALGVQYLVKQVK